MSAALVSVVFLFADISSSITESLQHPWSLKQLVNIKIDLTCQIHPAKYDYKYISVVAEEISGQHFDTTAIFRILVNKPCEKF